MSNAKQNIKIKIPPWGVFLLDLPWLQVAGELWKFGRKMWNSFAYEGVYEVLDYEATLELKNRKGTWANFQKRLRVRYLQDNIIAFQDFAWGDGEILVNYSCNPGKPVDCYRSGFKTYILLSLREIKNRNDIDEFNIRWDIRQGFLTKDGYWCADVIQRTKRVKISVIFPKTRPPQRLLLEESRRKRSKLLGDDSKKQLPDGRWSVTWKTNNPKLYELYVLRWIW